MRTSERHRRGDAGTYVIHIALTAERVVVVRRRISGKLRPARTYVLTPGHYLYVGSALAGGGLRKRVGRHLAPKTKRQWDLDFLLSEPSAEISTEAYGIPSPEEAECAWAARIFETDGTSPVLRVEDGSVARIKGFGAADCHHRCGCSRGTPAASRTHLFRVAWKPTLRRMRKILGRKLMDLRKEYEL